MRTEEPYFFGQFGLNHDRGYAELKNLSGVTVAQSIFLSPFISPQQSELTKNIYLIDPEGDIYPVALVISSLFPVNSSAKSNNHSQTLDEKLAFFEDLQAKYNAECFLSVQKASLHLACPYISKKKKRYENIPLTDQNLVELIWGIESIKEAKLKEAQDKREYIREKISLSDFSKKIMIEFSPEGRECENLLGRVDVRAGHLGKGKMKNVFCLYHCDTQLQTAGLYVNLQDESTIKCFENERKIEALIRRYYEEQRTEPDFRERVVISLCSEKRKKGDLKKAKLIQKEGITLDLLNKTDKSLSGEVYTKFMQLTFIKDILMGLAHLKVLKIKHRDIKSLNILIVHSEKEKRDVAQITDLDLATTESESLQLAGSWGHADPELFLNWRKGKVNSLLYASDLYSLGISFSPNKHPWWKKKVKMCNLEILIEQFNAGWNCHKEPYDKNSVEWGIWKLSHPSLKMRFRDVEEAQEYFNSIAF